MRILQTLVRLMIPHESDTVEVLAPAGNFACLAAALQGGAHAIYFGVGTLNMRAGSNVNFTPDDLPEVVQRCHSAGVRCYLTVNTIVYDNELESLRSLLQSAKSAGVDAVIASDQAVIIIANELGLPVHISTQLSISNRETLRFYSQWADTMVLARELTLEQVADLHSFIIENDISGPQGQPVRLEVFVHGALCMAISGKCYLSLHDAYRSANRGACVQICRRAYTLTDKETGNAIDVENEYLMSPKDLSTIHILDRILAAGVRVLKIEGRARSAEYVKTATRCYREAVEAIAAGTYTPERIAEWEQALAGVYNRGFWEGYYLGRKRGEWAKQYGSCATERKRIIGVVTNYFSRLGVAEVRVEAAPLREGASLYIIGDTSGVVEVVAKGLRIEDGQVDCVPQQTVCSFRVPARVRRGDRVFLRESLKSQPL